MDRPLTLNELQCCLEKLQALVNILAPNGWASGISGPTVSGTFTITDPKLTATSRVFLTIIGDGTTNTYQPLTYEIVGSSLNVYAGGDDADFSYFIIY